MKLVMSTTVAGVVLTLLATGLAEAQKKDYATVRHECRAEVKHYGGSSYTHLHDRISGGVDSFNKVRECIKARGYVPRLPPA